MPSIREMLSHEVLGTEVPAQVDPTRLAAGDIVESVQVGSETVELDEETGGHKLQRILAQYPDQPGIKINILK